MIWDNTHPYHHPWPSDIPRFLRIANQSKYCHGNAQWLHRLWVALAKQLGHINSEKEAELHLFRSFLSPNLN